MRLGAGAWRRGGAEYWGLELGVGCFLKEFVVVGNWGIGR